MSKPTAPLSAPPPSYTSLMSSSAHAPLSAGSSQGQQSMEIPSPVGDGLTSPGTAVRHSARVPSGSNIGLMKNADANANLDHLSFREKMKFFEQEIQEQSAESLAKPTAHMAGSGVGDMESVLPGMKSLETDAVHAQAVIAKAQEMSRGPSSAASPHDIAFADDDDHHTNHNGNSQIAVTTQRLLRVNLQKGSGDRKTH